MILIYILIYVDVDGVKAHQCNVIRSICEKVLIDFAELHCSERERESIRVIAATTSAAINHD